MRRHVRSRSICFQGFGAVLTVLAALWLALAGVAAPPEKPQARPEEPPVEPPLIQPAEMRPEYMATLAIVAPVTTEIASWSALGTVYTGASITPPLWSLRGAFSTKAGRINAGAASLFLSGFGPPATTPLVELALMKAAESRVCWQLINTDELRPFAKWGAVFLKPGFIRDRHGIYVGDPEYEAHWRTLVQAHYTSAKAFARSARHDVTYAHLFNEPEHYRGEVVHVSGRLIRLRKFPAPDEARADGVANLYEGWIMTDAYGKNPVCAVFTDLPDGLIVDNDRKYNDPVSFDGYFYKRWRYKASDNEKVNEFRDVPLLIGHTLIGTFAPVDLHKESDNWGHSLIWVFLGVLGSVVAAMVVVTVWFRYHDRRVRQRLSVSRHAAFVPPPDEEAATPNGDDETGESPSRAPFVD